MHSSPLMQVKSLTVGIENDSGMQLAVKALSIAIEHGQTFALVGESGCGKSMTAMALLRLLPDAGSILGGELLLEGQDLNLFSELALRKVRGAKIAMIFQEPSTSLNPVMCIGDQILESIYTHTALRGEAAKQKAIMWLSKVGIPEPERRLQDYPFQLSGGQKQRVMIAIALAAEPKLLIADEPTTALDVTIQAQVLDLLKSLQQELGMAILLITHDLGVVAQMAHQVALMYGGEILQTAQAHAFFKQPEHPYAQHLFSVLPSYAKRGQILGSVWQGQGAEPEVVSAPDVQYHPPRTLVPEQAPVLTVRDLAVYFPIRKGLLQRTVGWVKAVDGVSFELQAGRTLAIVGESGCGKTTSAKALLRLLDPRIKVTGQVSLLGQDLLNANAGQLKRLRQQIQIVFQDPYASLNGRMRIGEILTEGLLSLHQEVTDPEQRVLRLLDQVGLPKNSMTRYPHEFSGGQRQRIAIARALAVSPKVLVCDEPTSALDVSVQAQILNLLHQIQQDTGMAYLFITHNFAVVEYLADDIAVMHQGKIVETGTAEKVLQRASNKYTQDLLAAVPKWG